MSSRVLEGPLVGTCMSPPAHAILLDAEQADRMHTLLVIDG